jgi:SpoVK/Ycf46/Vps4 family AAA+-type ATPase
MATEWHNIYKPTKLEETCLSMKTINLMRKWIKEFKTINRPLFLHGSTGIGKTVIARLLLEENGYDVVELNISDMRDKNMISNIFKQALKYNNVLQMMTQQKIKKAIFIDEIDTFISHGDKNSTTYILDILKSYSAKKNKEIMNYPIVITASNIKDKKITSLRKCVIDAKMYKPNNYTMEKVIDRIFKHEKIKIDMDAKFNVIKKSVCDIRLLVTILYELCINLKKKHVDIEQCERFFKYFDQKKIDIEIYDAAHETLYKKVDTKRLLSFFESDKLLFPLLMHENMHKALDTKEIDPLLKLKLMDDCMDIITINDSIQQKMFNEQKWQLFGVSGYISTVHPNRIITKYKTKRNKKFSVDFSKILNKMSTFFTNQKGLLNLERDKKDIMNMTEIIQYYKKKKDVDKIVELIIENNINIEYLDLLLRTNNFDIKKININSKIKKKYKLYIKNQE